MRVFGKLVLEFLPLGLFFIFTTTHDIYVGTAVLMASTLVALVAVWVLYRKLAWMAIINAVTGVGAGALTLFWTDPLFVKMKPTVISLIFAAILIGGLLRGKPLLKPLIGEDLNLTEKGWNVITLRWGLYFVFVAITNEIVWRGADHFFGPGQFSDEIWAGFKAFGLMPLTILYALSQLRVLKRHRRCGDTESLADLSLFGLGASPAGIEALEVAVDKEPVRAGSAASSDAPIATAGGARPHVVKPTATGSKAKTVVGDFRVTRPART